MRYGRRPLFCRPAQNEHNGLNANSDDMNIHNKYGTRSKMKQQSSKPHRNRPTALPLLTMATQQPPPRKRTYKEDSEQDEKCVNNMRVDEGITGLAISTKTKNDITPSNERPFKPLPHFGGDIELRSLATTIRNEVIASPGVTWDEVVDLTGEFAGVYEPFLFRTRIV